MTTRARSLRTCLRGRAAPASVIALSFALATGPGASSSGSGAASPTVVEEARPPALLEQPPAPLLADLIGHWHRFGADEDDPTRLVAIDRALESVSWLMRGVAMRVLRQRTVPPPEMRFLLEDGRLFQERRHATGGLERRPVLPDGRTRPDEAGNDVSWHLEPQGLRLRWKHPQARGSTLFRLEPSPGSMSGANALVVDYVLEITAISDVEPVPFRARFGRADAGRSEVR